MAESPHRRRLSLGPLWLQVMVAILLGAVAGRLFPHSASAFRPLGDGFIRLISMTLAPIIFCSVVLGIAKMGDLKEVGASASRPWFTSKSSPPSRCFWASCSSTSCTPAEV